MRSTFKDAARVVLVSILLAQGFAPVSGLGQSVPQQPGSNQLEPYVARLRDALALSDEQVTDLRKTLASHAAKVNDLRRRAQGQPYSVQLQAEAEREQRAIREEISALLNDDQKSKLAGVDTRLPLPPPPPFILVEIPARSSGQQKSDLSNAELLIAAPAASTRGRNARLTDDQRRLQLLNRATFGPRPGDMERVRQMGFDRYLDEQLHPETIDDSEIEKRLAVLPTVQMTSPELYLFYPPPQVIEQRAKEPNPQPIFGTPRQVVVEMIQQKLVRAVSSNSQLQEVMTDFWFNHFNVFSQKEADQWLLTSYERDVIRPRALGKFRDLLEAVAESPAMLYYLDNWLSASPDSVRPRPPAPLRPPGAQPARPAGEAASTAPPLAPPGPGMEGAMSGPPNPQSAIRNPQSPPPPRRPGINENYARELMELHTMGVDGGYSQKDVQEVARCFTGWTIDRPFQGGGFVFRPWMHDAGAKTVLGVAISAGGGMSEGRRVIEVLSRHPSTARFVSKKLCQRFVSDSPSPQMVERITGVFLRTDGDIREVLRAIFNSPEFNSAPAFRSKVKSPLELVASAIRAVDGDTNGAPALHDWLRKMGEALYLQQAPTGYSEDSSVWMNTGVFLNRLNFGLALANNQIPGTRYSPARLIAMQKTGSENELAAALARLILHTELSAESRSAVIKGLSDREMQGTPSSERRPTPASLRPEAKPEAAATDRIPRAVGLLLGTAEFQRK